MACSIERSRYLQLYGPTTGDCVRLGDTGLWAKVERDLCRGGDELVFGAGKTLRAGTGCDGALTAAEGVPVRELAHAWNWSLARHGLEKDSRLGYSVGIGYPPDWGERTISIRTEDETVLAENMTFHVICGMWMTGFGYEVSESVRITRSGAETFTSFPRSLIRK